MQRRCGRSVASVLLAALLAACASSGVGPDGDARDTSPGPRAVVGATTAPTTCLVPKRLRGLDLATLPVAGKRAALTFDAGANADGVKSILATLEAEGVPASFFLTGGFVEDFPGKSTRVANRHLVGNHTMTHADLTKLTRPQVRAEVRTAQRVITETTGEDPRRFFRFPFGARGPRAIRVVNNLCYVPFRWTVDTLGWQGTSGGQSADTVVERVLDAATPGMIVLMHVGSNPDDGSTLDADALPDVIAGLEDLGYTFVRLSRIMSPAP